MVRLYLSLAFVSLLCAAEGQQIRGAIVDVTGAAIGGASVRLVNPDLEEVVRASADDSGKFRLESARSNRYVLKAWQRGFRSRRVPVVVGPENEAIDLGDIRLDLAGCDAPNVICDWFGEVPPPDPVVSRNSLRVPMGCMVTFATGKVFCPNDDTSGSHQAGADVRLIQDQTGIYLIALNGAALAAPNLPRGDCRDAHPRDTKIPIDGLGPGDDICLYAHDNHWSHMFFTDEVERASREIGVWQITRKR